MASNRFDVQLTREAEKDLRRLQAHTGRVTRAILKLEDDSFRAVVCSNGLQVMRVKTARGWVVLASDASHFYANFEQMRAYATVYNVGDMLEGFATVKRLATSPRHVIPGHDPLVLRRYPAPKPELDGITARLDVEPRE